MKYTDFEKHIKNTMHDAEIPVDINHLISGIHGTTATAGQSLSYKRLLLVLFLLFSLLIATLLVFNAVNSKAPEPESAFIPLNTIETDHVTDASNDKNNATINNVETIKQIHSKIGNNLSEKTTNVKHDLTVSEFKIRLEESGYSQINNTSATIIENTIIGISTTDTEIQESASTGYSTDQIVRPENQYATADLLPISDFAKLSSLNSIESLLDEFGKGKQKMGCPTFEKADGVTFELIPEIGYFRPLKRLSQIGSEPTDVFTLRDRNESSLEGLQGALYGRMRFGSVPLYLQAGVYFTRQSERMKLDYNYTRLDTVQGIISITKSPTGDTITTIYGDIIRETTVTGQSIGHHYFSLLDIPVSLGYEIDAGRFSIGIEGGVMFNIFLKSKGRLLDSATTFGDLGESSPFRTRAGISYFGSLNVSTPLGPGKIQLAARYRHIPNDFTLPGSQITQGYSQAGLHLGYIIPLSRKGLRVL